MRYSHIFFQSFIAGLRRFNFKPEIGGSPPASDVSYSHVHVSETQPLFLFTPRVYLLWRSKRVKYTYTGGFKCVGVNHTSRPRGEPIAGFERQRLTPTRRRPAVSPTPLRPVVFYKIERRHLCLRPTGRSGVGERRGRSKP